MASTKERGLLIHLDEGFFQRLDYETEIRNVPRRATDKKDLPRTDVIRSLLKFALDHFAKLRGETVPEAEPVDLDSMLDAAQIVTQRRLEAAEAPSEPEEEETPPEVVEERVEPSRVEAGAPGGESWFGTSMRTVGVVSLA